MAKKLLNEAQVRRFAKLANLSPINEMYGNTVQEEVMNEEEADLEIADAAELEGADELPVADEEEIEPAVGEEVDSDVELSADDVAKIADALPALQAIADAAAGSEMDVEPEMDAEEEEMPQPELEMDVEPEMDAEEEIMEALSGVEYVPDQKEIVSEVARRVAKRLLRAKKAEKQLQEALGKRRTK